MKNQKVLSLTFLLLLINVLVSYSQWTPSTISTTVDIGRTGNVAIGATTLPASTKFAVTGNVKILTGDLQVTESAANQGADITATDVTGKSLFMTSQAGKGYLVTNNSTMELILGAGSFGQSMFLKPDGRVGIGTYCFPTDAKLAVGGIVMATEVRVKPMDGSGCFYWPDYVFASDYKLRSLKEVEAYILKNKHLPEIPSAKEIDENGISIGDMNARLLKKMEEITLYLIQLEKDNEKLKIQIEELQKTK
jgi:hypothetical protein